MAAAVMISLGAALSIQCSRAAERPASAPTRDRASPERDGRTGGRSRSEETSRVGEPTAGTGGVKASMLEPAKTVRVKRKGGATEEFASARRALAEARTGDVVVLGAGTHRGPLEIRTDGVELRGEPGAFVNANDAAWRPQWRTEPSFGPHAFSSPIPFEPVTVSIDGRNLTDIRERRAGTGLAEVHVHGTGRGDRVLLGGLFTYLSRQGRLLVSFGAAVDPAARRMEAAPRGTSAVSIVGCDACTVEGLVVTGGRNGILLSDTDRSTVRRCLVFGVDVAVYLARGANRCRIVSNDLTWAPHAFTHFGVTGSDLWNAHKHYGTYDKWGVLARCAGSGNEVAFNYVYNVWNGIQNEDGVGRAETAAHYRDKVFKGIAEYNVGFLVHHNRVDLTVDDALEPGNELVDNQWYSNHVTRARCATRFKTVTIGPFYYYDNVIRDSNESLRFYKAAPRQATVYVYHNVVEHPYPISYLKVDRVCWDDPWLGRNMRRGTPGFHVLNNVFICTTPLANSSGSVLPDYTADHNLYTCGRTELQKRLGMDEHSLFGAAPEFVNPGAGDWRLKPGSAGEAGGMDLAAFTPALPFAAKKPPPGTSPNVGVVGIDHDRIPRGPVSGLWPVASSHVRLAERDRAEFRTGAVRWVSEKECEFVLTRLPEREVLSVRVIRVPAGGGSGCTIRAIGERGELLLREQRPPSARIEVIDLSVPRKANRTVRLQVKADRACRWRIDPRGAGVRVGVNAGEWLHLVKYDDDTYEFEHDVPAGTASFRLHSSAKGKVITGPGGGRIEMREDGRVMAGTDGGTCRISLQFWKKSKVRIEAEDAVLYFGGGGPDERSAPE